MFIERLKFKFAPNLRENFIQKDEQIWAIALAEYLRFLVKEVWISLNDHTEVTLIIYWAIPKQWKAIFQAAFQVSEGKFIQVLREYYPVVESTKYQVRKFPPF
ncbi:MAG: TIGR03792 family protein [Tolypothrix sp. T3-bin4]|nr:TIGR03792 family protein [Tolypothrix sp. T3-bin4]